MYRMRRPAIIALLGASGLVRLLQQGIGQGLVRSDALRHRARAVARAEVENIANLMDAEPMGLQFGLLSSGEPTGQFQILRARDRATLAINAFRSDSIPHLQAGVAMITGADEAVASHQRVAETMWREAVKGPAAATKVRELLAANPL
jgi:hypothetical protein